MSGKFRWEVCADSSDEPRSRGCGPVFPKPELGVKWEEAVSSFDVLQEHRHGVQWVGPLLKDNVGSLKEAVAFVCWEEEGDVAGGQGEFDRASFDGFSR